MQSRRISFFLAFILVCSLSDLAASRVLTSNATLHAAIVLATQQDDGAAANETQLEPNRKGAFQITRTTMPATIYDQGCRCFGTTSKRPSEVNIRGESDIVYEVRVGDNYDPKKPAGVFVYIHAGEDGRPPEGYEPVLAERNIIFIGANHSGNTIEAAWRAGMAAYAVEVLDSAYNLDRDRIYVAGLSGGGRAASLTMMGFQDVFSGGLPMVGANPIIPMRNADSKGKPFHSTGVKGFKKSDLKVAAKTGRYVFYTAQHDINRANVEAVYTGYHKNGFKHVTYLEEPDHGHSVASPEYLGKALDYLDEPIGEIAIARMKSAGKLIHSQPTLATRYFESVLMHTDADENSEDREVAKKALARLSDNYSTELDKTRAKIKRASEKSREKVLKKFATKWGEIGASDVAQMQTELDQAAE